ncbi:MAG: alginate export family protein, partial [Acidobacteria bacterium]|nr:alginate export family protein [Acidobacteriota bacterium]
TFQKNGLGEQRQAGDADRVTVGTRLVGTLPRHFDYNVELVGQAGDVAGDDARAGAAHLLLGYTLADIWAKPRLVGEYNFASGDSNPTDGEIGTFDQLFPTNHAKYGYADLVGWRNIHDLHFGLLLKPVQRIGLGFDTHSFWLASRRDAFYNATGQPVARVLEGARSRHVGREVDVSGSIKLTNHFFFEAALGYLFAGDFLKQATPGENSSYAYAMFSYRF